MKRTWMKIFGSANTRMSLLLTMTMRPTIATIGKNLLLIIGFLEFYKRRLSTRITTKESSLKRKAWKIKKTIWTGWTTKMKIKARKKVLIMELRNIGHHDSD